MVRPPSISMTSSGPSIPLRPIAPPARIVDDGGRHRVANFFIAAGVVIGRSSITRSVLSTGARVADGCLLDEVVVLPGARIGAGCKLRPGHHRQQCRSPR